MSIKGIPVGAATPRPDLMQNDPKKADYIKNKEAFKEDILNSETIQNTSGAIGEYSLIPEWVDGSYINSDSGNEIANANYSHTDYLQINGFKSLDVFTHVAASATVVGLAFYDINKTVMFGMRKDGGCTPDAAFSVEVPENAVYAMITCSTGYKDQFKVLGRDFLSHVRAVEDYTYITTTWTEGGYIKKSNGTVASLAAYSYSDYIPVNPYDKIYVRVNAANDVSGHAFYDKDKAFISGGNVCTFTYKKWQSGVVEVPENAKYFRITHGHGDGDPKLAIIPADSSYYHLLCKTEELDSSVKSQGESINLMNAEFASAKTTMSGAIAALNTVKNDVASLKEGSAVVEYAHALTKILCIGDSLTSGAYYANGWTGSSIDQNYPKVLGRMLKADVTNGGFSGYSASDWYTNKISQYNYADYDSFIIWLGSNNGLTDTLAEDVEAFDNYADYANTETGYYCKIIETIKEQNPDAFIVLCTVYASKTNLGETDTVLRKIASKYDCMVIEMGDLGVAHHPELHADISNMHLGKAGNIYVAQRIVDTLNKRFSRNPILCEFGMSAKTSDIFTQAEKTEIQNMINAYIDEALGGEY